MDTDFLRLWISVAKLHLTVQLYASYMYVRVFLKLIPLEGLLDESQANVLTNVYSDFIFCKIWVRMYFFIAIQMLSLFIYLL